MTSAAIDRRISSTVSVLVPYATSIGIWIRFWRCGADSLRTCAEFSTEFGTVISTRSGVSSVVLLIPISLTEPFSPDSRTTKSPILYVSSK